MYYPCLLSRLKGARRALHWLSLLTALGGGGLGLRAEAAPTTVTASELKRMTVEDLLAQDVVSVSRKPEPLSAAAGSVFLLRGQTAAGTGATTLPELLRMATDLFVAQKSSSEWAVNARGFVRTNAASNKLLVMVDGRTLYSPLFSNVFWESASVFLPDLDRLEVISGPAGSTWGSNAVNGVISIQSKSAHDTLGGLAFATVGTDENNFGVRYGANFGTTGAVRAYAQGAEHEPTRSAAGTDDNFDPWKSTQGGFRADWGEMTTGSFTLQGDAFAGRYENNPFPRNIIATYDVLGRWARELSANSDLWVHLYYDYARRNTQDLFVETSQATDLEFQHHLKFADGQDLLWGANYRLMEDDVTKSVGFVILPSKLDFGLGSVFAQHEIGLGDNGLRLTTGLRAEHNYFSGWELEPSVRLAWKRPRQLYWVAVSRATRIPSRLDAGFYLPSATPPYLVAGGPEFEAEVLQAYEVGSRFQPAKAVSVTATLYIHDYDRLRSTEPNGAALFPYTVQNKVQGQSYGGELFVDWDVTPWWRLRAGGFVMQQHTWLKSGGADTELGLGESSFPDYQAQLRNTFRLGKSVTWWTSLRQVAPVPAYDGGNGTIPAYTELDMTLSWAVRPAVELSLSGRNLLDPSHPEIGGAIARREIARSVESTIRVKF